MTDRAVISVHANPETSARLGRLAKRMKRSKSFLANEAIERYLAYEEWAVAEIRKGIDAAVAMVCEMRALKSPVS